MIRASLATLLLCGLAHADETAVRVGRAELGGLIWATTGDCVRAGNDLQRRQCQGLRVARVAAVRGQTLVVRGDVGALEVGGWDDTRTAIGFTVRGCLACAAPIDDVYLATRGGVTVAGGRLVGPELFHGLRAFSSVADGESWKAAAAAGRTRVDLYFRVGGSERWTQAGLRGLFVEPVGWRAYDACKGDLLGSSPATPASERDEVGGPGCGAPVVAPIAAASADELRAQPSAAEIKEAMAAVAPAVATCFDRFGVPGTADVSLEVAGDGEVSVADVHGSFAGTPTAGCVVAAVKKARFPRFARAPMRFHYPFVLR